MEKPNVSIIIRTKNEERWIAKCLSAVRDQDRKDFEIIIVDNESQDRTIEKVKQFEKNFPEGRLKVIKCSDYLPGKALNMGIKESAGTFIACLSGHCIPTRENWLFKLLEPFGSNDTTIAGVYGRQQPMSFTSNSDKRDLALIFGIDKKIQTKDSFFHNANSIIKRDVWDKIPFDEKVTNIEDRVWAREALEKGHKIVYTPEASVYHYHGIHQNGDAERCTNVVHIMKSMHKGYDEKSIEIEKLNIVAVIPIKGKIRYLNKKALLEYTVRRALESKYIKKTIVSTDNEEMAHLAEKLGAEAPFIREPYLSEERVDISKVLSYSLKEMEGGGIFPDLVVSLEATFPFRPPGLLDEMISQVAQHGYDSVIAGKKENKSIWKEKKGRIVQLDEGIMPRKFKEPSFVGLKGLGCITHPEFLRKGNLLGEKLGIYEIDNPYSHLEVRNEKDFEMASSLIDRWFK